MFKFINRIIASIAAKQNRRALAEGRPIVVIPPAPACNCHAGEPPTPDQFNTGVIPVGDWDGPHPHPLPMFAEKLKVMRQPILYVRRCKSCGGLTNAAGWNYKDASKT